MTATRVRHPSRLGASRLAPQDDVERGGRYSPVCGSRSSLGNELGFVASSSFSRAASTLAFFASSTNFFTSAAAPTAPSIQINAGGTAMGASESVARPQRARLDRRHQTSRPVAPNRALHRPGRAPREQTTRRGDQRHLHLLAEALAQHRAQVADFVGESELDRLAADPELAGEQRLVGALEALAAALLHQIDKSRVNFLLQYLEPLHVLGPLGLERVEDHLAFAGRVHAPLDTVFLDE